ncbi:hypothetical protein [Pyxidicoccus sp. MSG2]|uniref:hypothetical protein n=1 Tax=Pyxidicoccus sp. MSG2 TaxID=2996790 RepID=UPI002271D5F0|nr:hypothetical protein [Pyxidicoccus sp. MSG2]MCY1022667.1 hypothetical protein [Pyxidicoccus sp. MSG2]
MMRPALLLLLATVPVGDTNLRVQEGLPAGFQVDGNLGEWTQPPSLTLGEAPPDARSATVWLAVDSGGLAIAGELRDDPARLAGEQVEVSFSLPPPELPPLAFVDQFQEHLVPTEGDCPPKPPKRTAACQAWWKQQSERRQQLQDALVARYVVRSGGVVRFGQADLVGSARFVPMPGGLRFEALIPATAFPRTAEAPLAHLGFRVSVVDGGAGGSPRPPLALSTGLQAVSLSKPLRYGRWPELLAQALKAQPGASYQPGPGADWLEVWVNPAQAYQYSPKAPSPAVVRVDLSDVKPVAEAGDLELVSVPAEVNRRGGVDRWLVSRRGQSILDTRNIGNDALRAAPRASGVQLLQVYQGLSNPMGTGTCGECPLVSFQHFTMDAQGRFSSPTRLQGTGGLSTRPVAWTASEDLTRIEAFEVYPAPRGKQLAVQHTLDPKTGAYTTSSHTSR